MPKLQAHRYGQETDPTYTWSWSNWNESVLGWFDLMPSADTAASSVIK